MAAAGRDAGTGADPKKIPRHPLPSVRARYAEVAALKDAHPLRLLCRLLEVSASGYYRWCRRQPSAREREDAVLVQAITASHRRSRKTYRAPRIVADLRDQNQPLSRRRCARLMRQHQLKGGGAGGASHEPPTLGTAGPSPPTSSCSDPPRAGPPSLGHRHHGHPDDPRLAVLGGHPRSVEPSDRRLGLCRDHSGHAGPDRARPRPAGSPTSGRTAASLRPRQPVRWTSSTCERWLPMASSGA